MAYGNQYQVFYTGRHMAFVRVSITKMTIKQMADHIGVNADALKKQITKWRSDGYRIPHGNAMDIGSVTYRFRNGKKRRYVKTDSGWKLDDVIPRNIKRKPQKRNHVKKDPDPQIKHTQKQLQHVKRHERILPNKREDLSKKVSVYIPELRMRVFVDPDKTIAQVRAKYLEQREFMNKTYTNA